jgi:hypothetical protein
MAATTAVQVTSGYAAQPFALAGYHVEVWRVPAGSSSTPDTCTITPARGRFVAAVIGGAYQHALGTAGTDTTVTLTYLATIGASKFSDVMVLIQE